MQFTIFAILAIVGIAVAAPAPVAAAAPGADLVSDETRGDGSGSIDFWVRNP